MISETLNATFCYHDMLKCGKGMQRGQPQHIITNIFKTKLTFVDNF